MEKSLSKIFTYTCAKQTILKLSQQDFLTRMDLKLTKNKQMDTKSALMQTCCPLSSVAAL